MRRRRSSETAFRLVHVVFADALGHPSSKVIFALLRLRCAMMREFCFDAGEAGLQAIAQLGQIADHLVGCFIHGQIQGFSNYLVDGPARQSIVAKHLIENVLYKARWTWKKGAGGLTHDRETDVGKNDALNIFDGKDQRFAPQFVFDIDQAGTIAGRAVRTKLGFD